MMLILIGYAWKSDRNIIGIGVRLLIWKIVLVVVQDGDIMHGWTDVCMGSGEKKMR